MKEEQKGKILVVDDESILNIHLEMLLKASGYEVDIAMNGKEAIEKARQSRPSLVLMDLVMPRGDGLEATRKMTEMWPEVPIIIITALNNKKLLSEAMQAGARDYMLKPFENYSLLSLIDKYLEERIGDIE